MHTTRELTVQISEPQGDIVQVTWHGFDELIPVASLFDRYYSDAQLLNNLRLAMSVANQTDPSSAVLVAAIRQRGGIHLRDRTYQLGRCRRLNGYWSIPYGLTEDDESNALTVPESDLLIPAENQSDLVLANLATFLRLRGFDTLSVAARDAVAATTFRAF